MSTNTTKDSGLKENPLEIYLRAKRKQKCIAKAMLVCSPLTCSTILLVKNAKNLSIKVDWYFLTQERLSI